MRSSGVFAGVRHTGKLPRASAVRRSASSTSSVARAAWETAGSAEIRGSSRSMSGRPSALEWRRDNRFGRSQGSRVGPRPPSHGKSFGMERAIHPEHGARTLVRPASLVEQSWRSFEGTRSCPQRSRSDSSNGGPRNRSRIGCVLSSPMIPVCGSRTRPSTPVYIFRESMDLDVTSLPI